MTRNYFLLFLLAFHFFFHACSKPEDDTTTAFVKLFPQDTSFQAGGAIELPDGNFIVYGFTPEELNDRPIVIKTDKNGNRIWRKTLPASFHYCTMKLSEWGTLIAVGAEGETVMAIHVCETDFDLNMIGEPKAYKVGKIKSGPVLTPDFITYDKGLVIVLNAFKNGVQLPLILHINTDWTAEEPKLFDVAPGVDMMTKGICLDENGFTLVGSSVSEPNFGAPPILSYCLRLDSSFVEVWDTIFSNPPESVSIVAVSGMASSSVVIVGSVLSEGIWKNSRISDMAGTLYSQKVNSDGSVKLQKPYTNYGNFAHVCGLQQTGDGGYVIIATTNELQDGHLISDHRIYILKLDTALNEQWHNEFNGYNAFTAASVWQTADGGYLISGHELSGTYHFDICLIKTDANGNIVNQ